jgi:hypothetical protein
LLREEDEVEQVLEGSWENDAAVGDPVPENQVNEVVVHQSRKQLQLLLRLSPVLSLALAHSPVKEIVQGYLADFVARCEGKAHQRQEQPCGNDLGVEELLNQQELISFQFAWGSGSLELSLQKQFLADLGSHLGIEGFPLVSHLAEETFESEVNHFPEFACWKFVFAQRTEQVRRFVLRGLEIPEVLESVETKLAFVQNPDHCQGQLKRYHFRLKEETNEFLGEGLLHLLLKLLSNSESLLQLIRWSQVVWLGVLSISLFC